MNIFVLDKDPAKIPKHYCDIHVNKMFMESIQLLSTAVQVALGEDIEGLPKKTHINHPCAKWARENMANYGWLWQLAYHLDHEFSKRRGKLHAWSKHLTPLFNYSLNGIFPKDPLTPWPQVMPDEYKNLLIKEDTKGLVDSKEFNFNQTISAYRRYYASKLRDFRKRGLI